MINPYEKALTLLGSKAVLVPIAEGTKKPPRGHLWKRLSLADTKQAAYIQKLEASPAVAAMLGPVSGDLIAIDLDTQEAAKAFLTINPTLETTLRTHGQRGCVLWLQMTGDYPICCIKFRDADGKALGEWRGGSCYSIVSGKHKDGGEYTVLVDAPPLPSRFGDIHFPDHWLNAPKLSDPITSAMQRGIQKNGNESACVSACSSAWHPQKPWESDGRSRLEKLYDRFILHHWTPAARQRNDFIVNTIPFLYSAVREEAVMPLVMRYYSLNQSHFKDCVAQHRREAEAQLRAVGEKFISRLNPREQQSYSKLWTERERAALRICRHLANHKSERLDCEGHQFVLSYEDLGDRLLVDSKTAFRLMHHFQKLGLVTIIRKGQRRAPGIRQTPATVWQYCL